MEIDYKKVALDLHQAYRGGYFFSQEADGQLWLGSYPSFREDQKTSSMIYMHADPGNIYFMPVVKLWAKAQRIGSLEYVFDASGINVLRKGVLTIPLQEGKLHLFKEKKELIDFLEERHLERPAGF